MAREGVPLIVIQRQLGHTNLGITSIYLQGIDSAEIIDAVHAHRPPVVPVNSTLRTWPSYRSSSGGTVTHSSGMLGRSCRVHTILVVVFAVVVAVVFIAVIAVVLGPYRGMRITETRNGEGEASWPSAS
jgi:hypothetical protein